MKVNEFIEKLKEVEKLPTLYEWGAYGNKKKGKYLLFDCSGLIKGIIWGYPDNGKYGSNNLKDMNANTFIKNCYDVSSDFSKVCIGCFVHMDGHCGIYVGNGNVIESSPKWENGVQITRLNQRKWTSHGKLKCIEYDDNKVNINNWYIEFTKIINPPLLKKGDTGSYVLLLQKRLKEVGFSKIELDGNFGSYTETCVKEFQNNRKLVSDGHVGNMTWAYIISGKVY